MMNRIEVQQICTQNQLAEAFTKALLSPVLKRILQNMGI